MDCLYYGYPLLVARMQNLTTSTPNVFTLLVLRLFVNFMTCRQERGYYRSVTSYRLIPRAKYTDRRLLAKCLIDNRRNIFMQVKCVDFEL